MGRLICCTVGSLMGDAWMRLPAIVDLCRTREVAMVSGTYALPLWEWARKHIIGANYEIIRTIPDPDDPACPYCPGFGYPALTAALEFVRGEMPNDEVLGDEAGSYYAQLSRGEPINLELNGVELTEAEYVVLHPVTSHSWKNLGEIFQYVTFRRSVKIIGLPGEFRSADRSWQDITGQGFDVMAGAVLGAYGVAGVLSAWTNLAGLFRKKQIIASFTPDTMNGNPMARKLITPSVERLQAAIREMDF